MTVAPPVVGNMTSKSAQLPTLSISVVTARAIGHIQHSVQLKGPNVNYVIGMAIMTSVAPKPEESNDEANKIHPSEKRTIHLLVTSSTTPANPKPTSGV